MDLLGMLLSAGGGNAIKQLSANFGLSESQTTSAVSNLLPALGAGLARNAAQPGGLEALTNALSSRKHETYLDTPEKLSSGEAINDGNGILGHILGTKDASRAVARQAAAQTGIGEDVLKKMLPAVAGLAMGMLSKQGPAAAIPNQSDTPAKSGGLMGILGNFLDSNHDGSVLDDIAAKASELFKK